MPHFARVVNEIVTQVVVSDPDFLSSIDNSSDGEWVQTSYNTRGGVHYDPHTGNPSRDQTKAFRKNYAGIGYVYDKIRNAFIPPKPYDSWLLNTETCLWQSPVPIPDNDNQYQWDEKEQKWIKV